jgi:hypothetical protein
MGYVPYVGFTIYRRATVMTRLYFKILMFMQMFCKKKRKKKRVVTRSIFNFFFFFFLRWSKEKAVNQEHKKNICKGIIDSDKNIVGKLVTNAPFVST